MDINTWLLVAAALLPAIVLCVYIFKKDRVEKEPIGLLLKLFAFGAFACYPAAEIEGIVIGLIDETCFNLPFGVYNFIKYLIGVALVEEGLKWIILKWFTRRNTEFNSLFDGVIYAVFVSLGFAALENVFYVLEYGFSNAVMRAFLSVPGHMFFAVMMGYHYSLWHMTEKAGMLEKQLLENVSARDGVRVFSTKKNAACSLIMPVLAHGIYNHCCTMGTLLSIVVFYLFVIFMYVSCFTKIRKMSKADMSDVSFAKKMLIRKYPLYTDYILTQLNKETDEVSA